MPETNGAKNGVKNGLSARQTFVLALVTAMVSSSGFPYVLSGLGVNPFRPDPYTRSDAKFLESRVKSVEAHLTNHPDQTGQFDRRITVLEVKLEVIISNQQRILERLESQ